MQYDNENLITEIRMSETKVEEYHEMESLIFCMHENGIWILCSWETTYIGINILLKIS